MRKRLLSNLAKRVTVTGVLPFYLFTFLPLYAQTQLSAYQPGITADGAVYFLPKTVLRISVRVEKTTFQPGDFCKYAQRFLRMNDAGQEPTVAHKLIDVSVVPIALADTTKAFSVKFNAKTVASNLQLSKNGTLLAINAENKEPEEPARFVAAPKTPSPKARQFLTEEILAAGSTAKMAELTAREIYDLRENRNLLIKGQADFMPKDGEQLRLMLNRLDTQDKALSSLFCGTTECDTLEEVFMVYPNEKNLGKKVLFRLSQPLGLVDADDLSGTPYYIIIEDLHSVPPTDKTAAQKKKKVETGIYVNVPGKMRVTVSDGLTPFYSSEMPAPQFGNVELLSGDLFNKRYTTQLWLHPITGAVERMKADQPK